MYYTMMELVVHVNIYIQMIYPRSIWIMTYDQVYNMIHSRAHDYHVHILMHYRSLFMIAKCQVVVVLFNLILSSLFRFFFSK